MTDNSAAAL